MTCTQYAAWSRNERQDRLRFHTAFVVRLNGLELLDAVEDNGQKPRAVVASRSLGRHFAMVVHQNVADSESEDMKKHKRDRSVV
jgi:hypothetical protein